MKMQGMDLLEIVEIQILGEGRYFLAGQQRDVDEEPQFDRD